MELERRATAGEPDWRFARFGRPVANGWHPAVVYKAREKTSSAGNEQIHIVFGVFPRDRGDAPQGPATVDGYFLPSQTDKFDEMLLALAPEVLAEIKSPGEEKIDWRPDDERAIHGDGFECDGSPCERCAKGDIAYIYGLKGRDCEVRIVNEDWRGKGDEPSVRGIRAVGSIDDSGQEEIPEDADPDAPVAGDGDPALPAGSREQQLADDEIPF